ncbi:MAG: hypothetical protein QOG27_1333 [Verrucomicrobiota bacterium]|jgi:hypothetical protein
MAAKRELIPVGRIAQSIHLVRGQKVMLDVNLAALYEVPTGHLNRAVKRNFARFPSDFMFRINRNEARILKCQFGISSWGGRRRYPYAFTEQGVAMLSSVLNSPRAVKVNLAIIEAIRQLMAAPAKLQREIGFHVREKAPRYRTRTRR